MYKSRFFCITLFVVTLSIGLFLHSAEAEDISLSSASEIYYLDDYVVIFGTVNTVFEEMPVTIQIYHGTTLIDVGQVEVALDGTFVATFKASGHQWKEEGIYTVRGFYTEKIISEITFEFYNEIIGESRAVFPVNIPNSGTFDVGYTVRGGDVNNIEMDMERYSILIQTTMDTNGNIVLKLPRESFDAQSNGDDETFIVLVSKENTSAENFAHVEYEEIGTGPDYRIIRIPLEADDKWIEVVGTYIIPEFGSLVMMVLLAATVSAIIVSKSKFSIRYN